MIYGVVFVDMYTESTTYFELHSSKLKRRCIDKKIEEWIDI